MAKKRKRSKRKNQYQAIARQPGPRAAASSSATARDASGLQMNPVSQEAIAQAQVDFGEEYRYVITDLRNMGILAAAMFGLVGILALILR